MHVLIFCESGGGTFLAVKNLPRNFPKFYTWYRYIVILFLTYQHVCACTHVVPGGGRRKRVYRGERSRNFLRSGFFLEVSPLRPVGADVCSKGHVRNDFVTYVYMPGRVLLSQTTTSKHSFFSSSHFSFFPLFLFHFLPFFSLPLPPME